MESKQYFLMKYFGCVMLCSVQFQYIRRDFFFFWYFVWGMLRNTTPFNHQWTSTFVSTHRQRGNDVRGQFIAIQTSPNLSYWKCGKVICLHSTGDWSREHHPEFDSFCLQISKWIETNDSWNVRRIIASEWMILLPLGRTSIQLRAKPRKKSISYVRNTCPWRSWNCLNHFSLLLPTMLCAFDHSCFSIFGLGHN